MKHIKQFESYRIEKKRNDIIKESVLQVNDIYKVRTMVDIPQSLINAYVKKVKDNTGKNLRQFFGDVDIAEEIVKFVNLNHVDAEKIPANALMGGPQGQAQTQMQGQAQPEGQMQTQVQPEAQPQAQDQSQGEAQPQTQAQPEAQPQAQTQGQSQVQVQTQPEGQGSQEDFEDVSDEEETIQVGGDEESQDEEDELPL
jgi:hypothetical protein